MLTDKAERFWGSALVLPGAQLLSCLQSKLSELEVRVAELVTQMNSVVADKTNLESRVSVLLRVLQMRDEQIEQLRSGQKVRCAASNFSWRSPRHTHALI